MLTGTAGKLFAHIVGGTMFFSLGAATTFVVGTDIFKQTYSYGKVHAVDQNDIERLYQRTDEKEPTAAPRQKSKAKFVIGLTAAIFVILGFLMEAISGLYNSGNFFHFFAHEVQHLLFLPWAVAFMLESGHFAAFEDIFAVNPLYSMCALIMAHFCQFLLLEGHADMKHMNGLSNIETDTHAIMGITAKISFVISVFQVLGQLANNQGIAKGLLALVPAPFMLQGLWVLTIAYVSYYAQYENLSTETIYSLYYVEVMVVFITYAFVLRKFYKDSLKS